MVQKKTIENTVIFCLIFLQTLIYVINPQGLHSRFVGEELRGIFFFLDNFDLAQLNKLAYSLSPSPLYTVIKSL